MLEIMHDVSISARLTTTTTNKGWWSIVDHVRCIHLSTVNYNYDEGGMVEYWRSCTMYPYQHGTTKEGWWSIGDHVRCIHLGTVNYNYDEGGMVE